MSVQVPRGIRNNNPLNIRLSNDKWVGMCDEQTDSQFCQFQTMKMGARAALKLIRNYLCNGGCKTLADIIKRWAPPSDNNDTDAYINRVAIIAGVDQDKPLKFDNKLRICKIARAMAIVENGSSWAHYFSITLFKEAYDAV